MVDPLSADNPLVKTLRLLHRPEGRRTAQQVLIEGRRAIDGFLASGWQADLIFIPDGESPPEHWPPTAPISNRASARLSQAHTPSGWFARFPLPPTPPLTVAHGGLILVNVQDPGNVGTLLRSAAAFACPQVVMVGGADPWGHKVLQATAGTLGTLPLIADPQLTPIDFLGGAPLTGLVVTDGTAPDQLPPIPRWLVVGSEAHGLDPAWHQACTCFMTLAMPGKTESLNAAVAGSIACYVVATHW